MENDHGTRGQPASDGPLQGFFGGVRRCTERATNIYAGQGGGSPSGELGRMKERVARLEIQSASYEGMVAETSETDTIRGLVTGHVMTCCQVRWIRRRQRPPCRTYESAAGWHVKAISTSCPGRAAG